MPSPRGRRLPGNFTGRTRKTPFPFSKKFHRQIRNVNCFLSGLLAYRRVGALGRTIQFRATTLRAWNVSQGSAGNKSTFGIMTTHKNRYKAVFVCGRVSQTPSGLTRPLSASARPHVHNTSIPKQKPLAGLWVNRSDRAVLSLHIISFQVKSQALVWIVFKGFPPHTAGSRRKRRFVFWNVGDFAVLIVTKA